ncbi:MAG: sterol desaturase family protein [Pseudomonadota bacterium]|nr:sterol desaturase family protein [Pseudomonadota bacterium]
MLESFAPSERQSWALLILPGTLLAEYLWLRSRGNHTYDWRESLVSVVIAAGDRVIRAGTALLILPLYQLVYAHRLLDLTIDGPAAFAALIVAVDFAYYWTHRAMHGVRWMWATHAVHHSSKALNLSAAYRLGWTDLVSGTWAFLLPFVWLGVPPLAVLGAFALNLGYQFFLHTEAVGRLGPLEAVLNTPNHHRVHHAHNDGCVDRNFGGILIVWDRWFGTFAQAPSVGSLRYGLLGSPRCLNPIAVVFGEWHRLTTELRQACNLWQALRIAFSIRTLNDDPRRS